MSTNNVASITLATNLRPMATIRDDLRRAMVRAGITRRYASPYINAALVVLNQRSLWLEYCEGHVTDERGQRRPHAWVRSFEGVDLEMALDCACMPRETLVLKRDEVAAHMARFGGFGPWSASDVQRRAS